MEFHPTVFTMTTGAGAKPRTPERLRRVHAYLILRAVREFYRRERIIRVVA